MFSKPLSPFEEPKTNKSVFQSEPEVVPCFEMNYKLFERHKNLFSSRQRQSEKILWTRPRKWQAKVQPNKTKKRQRKKCQSRLSYIQKKEKNTFSRDAKLSVLSFGHFISFSFATKEVKGVNCFPSRANDLEI